MEATPDFILLKQLYLANKISQVSKLGTLDGKIFLIIPHFRSFSQRVYTEIAHSKCMFSNALIWKIWQGRKPTTLSCNHRQSERPMLADRESRNMEFVLFTHRLWGSRFLILTSTFGASELPRWIGGGWCRFGKAKAAGCAPYESNAQPLLHAAVRNITPPHKRQAI